MALGGIALVRAITLVSRRPLVSALFTGLSLLLLYWVRPTFTWIFVVGWLITYAIIFLTTTRGNKRRLPSLVALFLLIVPIFFTQVHYITSFGTLTTSSWTGQNIMKAQTQSGWLQVSEDTLNMLSVNQGCEYSLLSNLLSNQAQNDVWDIDKSRRLPGCADLLSEKSSPAYALSMASKDSHDNAVPNLNSLAQLELSRAWHRIAIEVTREEPQRLLWMAITSGSGSVTSGLGLYLSPPESYFGLEKQRTAYPTLLLLVGGLISLLIAPSSLVLGTLGVVSIFRNRTNGLNLVQISLIASMLLLGYHLAASTLFEYGENMRYQAEVVPVMIAISALALKQISTQSSTGIQNRARSDHE